MTDPRPACASQQAAERARLADDPTAPPAYAYVGEFIDPEQTPLTASLYACGSCGALVDHWRKQDHSRWHRWLEQVTTPLLRIG